MQLFVFILRYCHVPNHIAFIMDGNRRFARERNWEISKGHLNGSDQLEVTLKWCLDLGVKEVTCYAFSIENFRRSKDEVDALFHLCKVKFTEFLKNESFIHEKEIRVNVIGDLKLLPIEILNLAKRVAWSTRNYSKFVLNIACPYTSTQELGSVNDLIENAILNGELIPSDITEQLRAQLLYTNTPLDIMVRTSGEIRLSDFMLHQTSRDCFLYFCDTYWPEFTFWTIFPMLLYYQYGYYYQMVVFEFNLGSTKGV